MTAPSDEDVVRRQNLGAWVHWAAVALRSVPIAVLYGAFVALAAAKVAAFGVCCADDGYFASVAKNVVAGLGYGTTVSGEGFRHFDPEIGSGPAIILPAAAAIALFGNRFWVPGAVEIAVWGLLLLAIHRGLRRRDGLENLRLASGVFLLGVILLFPFHFEQWFALLGEVPAALFLLLGVVVLGRSELSRRSVALASLFCSLALLTKLLSAILCAAFFVALGARVLREGRGVRGLVRFGVVAVGAFAAPVVAFEVYKVVALGGLGAWRQNVAGTMDFVRMQGAPSTPAGVERWTRAWAYDQAFAARFGVSVWQLVVGSLAAALILLRIGGVVQRRLALPIALGVLMSSAWFLFRSVGWPRYLVMTLILAWALVALVLTTMRRGPATVLGGALLLALFAVNRHKLPQLARGLEHGAFSKSPELVSALELTAFVDARAGEIPLVNQWWATTADLEYYARSVDVFRRYLRIDKRGAYYVVFKRQFKHDPDLDFDRLIGSCVPAEKSFEPYAVLRCGW